MSTRRLAAIMFTDIVGYTAMMQENEQHAAAVRERHREVFHQTHEQFNGEVLQYYGDGTLSIFHSAIEAVQASIAMQHAFQISPVVPLRIGLHLGDIVFAGTEIYGDGVNLASRVESLGVPGAILISKKIQAEIHNQTDISTQSLGQFEFKNIKAPTEVFAVSNPGIKVPARSELKGKLTQHKKSIAVLPFVNMSSDPENEYFSDGLTEEILNVLVRIEGLQVTARTSSFAFKNQNLDMREIGRMLGVAHLLEGSVRKAGNRVRITAQLINSLNGYHLFSETYDRDLEDIFAVQDEISLAIAHRLRESLGEQGHKASLDVPPTRNLIAYDTYLKGLFYYNQWNEQAATNAIPHFQEAIALQEDFAQPHSYLAACYIWQAFTGQLSWQKVQLLAGPHIQRALDLAPDLIETLMNQSHIKTFVEWDWAGLEILVQQMLRSAPGKAEIYIPISTYYGIIGDTEAFVNYCEQGLQLDPVSVPYRLHFSLVLIRTGQYEQANRHLDQVLQFMPKERLALECKGWVHAYQGEYEKSLSYFEQIETEFGYRRLKSACLATLYAMQENRETALLYLKTVKQINAQAYGAFSLDLAIVYTALEDYDAAFDALEQAVEMRLGEVTLFPLEPGLSALTDDPRFGKLVQQIGAQ